MKNFIQKNTAIHSKQFILTLIFILFFTIENIHAQTTVMPEYDLNKNIPGAVYKFSFVHMSDIHIGEGFGDYGSPGFFNDEIPAIDTSKPARALREAVKWINAHEQDKNIKFAVISGDLTGSAEKSEFTMVKKIMSELHVPYVPVIGNHDAWPYVRYQNEAPTACGDSIINEVFDSVYTANKTFFTNWNDGTRLTRVFNPESNHEHYLGNFSFEYDNFIFYALDFNPRYHVNKPEPGIGPEAQLMDWTGGTYQWLKHELATNPRKANKNVCFISHHPATDNVLFMLSGFVFDANEYKKLTTMLAPYKNNLGVWMTGHIHIDYDYQLAYNNTGIMQVRMMAANKDYDSAHFEIINVYEIPTVTGIRQQTDNKTVKLFPNPNDGKFTIAEELFSPNSVLKLYDVIGNLIYEKEMRLFATSNETYQFDFSFLPKGSYFISLTDDDHTYSQRMIVQ
ncbi:MAG: metallophosphoesterase [Chitinophagales bacterium]